MSIVRLIFQAFPIVALLTGGVMAQTVVDPRHDPANPSAKESPPRHSMPSLMENAPQAILEEQNAPSSTPATNTGMKGMPGMNSSPAPAPSTSGSMKDMPGMSASPAPTGSTSGSMKNMPGMTTNAAPAASTSGNMKDMPGMTTNAAPAASTTESMKDMPGMTTNTAPAASTTDSMKDMPGMSPSAAPSPSASDITSSASTPSVTFSPLYIHVLINHIPELGLGISLFALFLGLVFRSREARRVGLILVFLCAASAWPVLLTGQKGYNAIYFSLEPADQAWLGAHMHAAEEWIWVFYVLAAVAMAGIVFPLKWPRSEIALVIAVLVLGAGTFALSGYIAYLGGRVRHIEFRDNPPPMVKHE